MVAVLRRLVRRVCSSSEGGGEEGVMGVIGWMSRSHSSSGRKLFFFNKVSCLNRKKSEKKTRLAAINWICR